MALNGEELHAHEKFKRERESYARPTEEQTEIAQLKQRLHLLESEKNYLLTQRDIINEALRLCNTGERSEGITLDTIRGVMR